MTINRDDIRSIGFDLDQTLYPKSPEVDQAIQAYIHEKIAQIKGCSVEEGKRLFLLHYPKLSGRSTLLALGIANAEEIVQKALENADIAPFLKPNGEVFALLKDLKTRYATICLITGSNKELARKKLAALEIPVRLFDHIVTGEVSKSDGTAYREWLRWCREQDPMITELNLVYIGDRPATDVDVPVSLGIAAILVNVAKNDPTIHAPQLPSLLDVRKLLL